MELLKRGRLKLSVSDRHFTQCSNATRMSLRLRLRLRLFGQSGLQFTQVLSHASARRAGFPFCSNDICSKGKFARKQSVSSFVHGLGCKSALSCGTQILQKHISPERLAALFGYTPCCSLILSATLCRKTTQVQLVRFQLDLSREKP